MINLNLFCKKIIIRDYLTKVLFYSFPLIIFFSSGIINFHLTLLIIFGLFTIYKLKLKIKFILIDYLIFLFFFLNLVNTLNNYSNLGDSILIKSIFSFRFFILFIVVRILFFEKILDITALSIVALISSILLSLDIFLQHITGTDIFGFPSFSGRYNGFFEHEAIAGSYIQKFLLLSFISLFSILLSQKKIVRIITITLIINILGLGVLLSLDRMPFIVLMSSIFLLFVFLKNFRIIFISNFIILILLFFFFLKNYDTVKSRYEYFNRDINFIKILDYSFFKKIFQTMNENSPSLVSHKKEKIFHGDYSKLFTAAYFVSSKNNFLGSGHKSFMTECLRLNEKNISCNNHPHNIYLEVLVNLGIFGVFILTIILFLIINNIIQFLLKKNLDENHKITLIIFLVFLICEFIPIRSFGSIFTTINGYIFWFLLALLSSLNPKKLLIRKVITHDL